MAKQVLQVDATVPAGPDGTPPAVRVVNAFDTTVPTAATDLGEALLAVVAQQQLTSGTQFSMTVTVVDLVNG